jgi:hypothetical protein
MNGGYRGNCAKKVGGSGKSLTPSSRLLLDPSLRRAGVEQANVNGEAK